MSISTITNGNDVPFGTPPSGGISFEHLKKQVDKIKSQAINPEVDIRTTQVAFMVLNDQFRTYTHTSHTELNAKQKLELRRSFIDLTDTISEKVLEQMQKQSKAVGEPNPTTAKENEEETATSALKEENRTSSPTESGIPEPQEQGTSGVMEYFWGMMGSGATLASNMIGTAATLGKTLLETAVGVASTATNALGVTTPVKLEVQKEREELEGMLKGLMGIQAALYDETHPISVKHAKDLITEILKNGSGSDVQTIADFLQSEALKEEEHQGRANKIKESLKEMRTEEGSHYENTLFENIQQQTVSFMKMVSESAVDYIQGKKKEVVASYVKQFTPQELFGNQSIKLLIKDLITDLLDQGGYKEGSILAKIAMIQVEKRQEHLLENLGILADERNLACLGANMAEEIRQVASKVRDLEDPTPQQMIASLGYLDEKGKAMSIEVFREKMDADITTSLARLISKDAEISQEPEHINSNQIAKGVWGIMWSKLKVSMRKLKIQFINNIKNKMSKSVKKVNSKVETKVAEKVLQAVSPPSWLVSAFFPKTQELNSKGAETTYEKEYAQMVEDKRSQAKALGYGKEFAKLEKCSDVLILHLFHCVAQNMSNIASQSKKNTIQPVAKGYEDSAKASENLRKGIADLTNELGNFKSDRGGMVGYGLDQLTGFFGSLVAKQGTGSFLDVTTDAVALLQPAWKEWLSGKDLKSDETPRSETPSKP